ncbi:MAG: hypothetical protein NXY57DRAFT_967656 [Lentinula lateritia]|nr:MAG: hypothetical protein NXY57DRAFT_967656 [Lentinula lateritia]
MFTLGLASHFKSLLLSALSELALALVIWNMVPIMSAIVHSTVVLFKPSKDQDQGGAPAYSSQESRTSFHGSSSATHFTKSTGSFPSKNIALWEANPSGDGTFRCRVCKEYGSMDTFTHSRNVTRHERTERHIRAVARHRSDSQHQSTTTSDIDLLASEPSRSTQVRGLLGSILAEMHTTGHPPHTLSQNGTTVSSTPNPSPDPPITLDIDMDALLRSCTPCNCAKGHSLSKWNHGFLHTKSVTGSPNHLGY